MKYLILLSVLIVSSFASAGAYEDTLQRAQNYRNSDEFRAKEAAVNQANAQKYNARLIRDATIVANRFHKGFASGLDIVYGQSGWIEKLEMSCRDGNDCKCQRWARVACECVNRMTFEKHLDAYDDWYLHGSKYKKN